MPITTTTRQSTVAALPALLLACCFCQHPAVDATAQDARFRAFDQEAQRNAMGYRWLRWSVEHIGHRLTGSPEGAKAERAADSLFRLSGLEHVQPFPFSAQAWSRGRVQLTVGDGQGYMHLQAVALANTPVESDVEAPLVDAGNGLAEDHDRLGDGLRGKVALVNIGLVDPAEGARNLHRSEKAALALSHGAAAIVFVNQVDGGVLLTGTASIDGRLIPVPAACIAVEDGTALRERLARGEALTVRLGMSNHSRVVEAKNTIAEIRGTKYPDEVILVGGHLDSWDLATGATDNGLGSFSILDLARAMRAMPEKPERTVRFVLFMGEEQGLLGSRALVEHYRNTGELARIKCMVNLDMTGNPRGFHIAGPGDWTSVVGAICKDIHAVDSTDFKGLTRERYSLHSDHQPFLLAGVPVLSPISDLGKHVYGCYHSSCDDIHLVDPQAMVNNVRFTGMLVYGLAARESLPPHFTEDELRRGLIEHKLENPLRIGGDWPW